MTSSRKKENHRWKGRGGVATTPAWFIHFLFFLLSLSLFLSLSLSHFPSHSKCIKGIVYLLRTVDGQSHHSVSVSAVITGPGTWYILTLCIIHFTLSLSFMQVTVSNPVTVHSLFLFLSLSLSLPDCDLISLSASSFLFHSVSFFLLSPVVLLLEAILFSHTGNISGKCSLRHLRKSQADDCSVTRRRKGRRRVRAKTSYNHIYLPCPVVKVNLLPCSSLLRANDVAEAEKE